MAKSWFCVALSVLVVGACGPGDEVPLGEVAVSRSAILSNSLGNDLFLDCGEVDSGNHAVIAPTTQFSVSMKAGDTLWVSSSADIEYVNHPNPTYNKEFVATALVCANDGDQPVSATPASKYQLSSTGANLWARATESHLRQMHTARAIFTATRTGPHHCWAVYSCTTKSGNPGVDLRIIGATTKVQHYAPNAYPGTNFRQVLTGSPPSEMVTSTATVTPGGSLKWNAGQSANADTLVTVGWSPRLTVCVADDPTCWPVGGFEYSAPGVSSWAEWRLVVYQLNGSTICNKAFGTWVQHEIRYDDHHDDVDLFQNDFPIVTGLGSEGIDCGSVASNPSRQFSVFAQIRKAANDGYGDVSVYGSSSGTSNLFIYSK